MTGYVRSYDKTDGVDPIRSGDFESEFTAIETAFNQSSGHRHDGTVSEGPYVAILADTTAKNKVVIDSTNHEVEFWNNVGGSAVQQIIVKDGVIEPTTNNDINLGSSSKKFKTLYCNTIDPTSVYTIDSAMTTSEIQAILLASSNSIIFWKAGTYTITSTLQFYQNATHIAMGKVDLRASGAGPWTEIKHWDTGHTVSYTCTLDSQTLYAMLDFTGAHKNRFLGQWIADCNDITGLCGIAMACNPSFDHAWMCGFDDLEIYDAYVGFLGQNSDSGWTGSHITSLRTYNCKYDIWVQGNSVDDVFIATLRTGDVSSARCNGGTCITLADTGPDGVGSPYSARPADGLTFGAVFLRTSLFGTTGAGYKKGIYLHERSVFKASGLDIEGSFNTYPIQLESYTSFTCPDIKIFGALECLPDTDSDKALIYTAGKYVYIDTSFNERIEEVLTGGSPSNMIDYILKVNFGLGAGTEYHHRIKINAIIDYIDLANIPIKFSGTDAALYTDISYSQGGRDFQLYWNGTGSKQTIIQKGGLLNIGVGTGLTLYPSEENLLSYRIYNTTGGDRILKLSEPNPGDMGKRIVITMYSPTYKLSLDEGYSVAYATSSYVRTATGADRYVTAGTGIIELVCVTEDNTQAYWFETWSSGLT